MPTLAYFLRAAIGALSVASTTVLTASAADPSASPLAAPLYRSEDPKIARPKNGKMNELVYRSRVYSEVIIPFADQAIEEQERRVATLRQSAAKSPSGLWQLLFHYDAMAQSICPLDDDTIGKALTRWSELFPPSPTPLIYQSLRLECRLEQAREKMQLGSLPGGKAGKLVFRSRAREWKDYLLRHGQVGKTDPQYFTHLIRVMGHLEEPFDQIMAVLEEAVAVEPTFHQSYFAALESAGTALSPQSLESFANYASDKTEGTDAAGMYVRVYWFSYQALFGAATFSLPTINWAKMKAAMDQVLARYPDEWNLNHFALFSCLRQDPLQSRLLLAQIGSPLLPVWRDAQLYRACKEWADSSGGSAPRVFR